MHATGKGGRVLKEDILKHLNISSEDSNDVSKMEKIKQSPILPKQQITSYRETNAEVGEDKVVPIKGYMKAMVKTMNSSLV